MALDRRARARTRGGVAIPVGAIVALFALGARGAVLPNEAPADAPLSVAARAACGPFIRPGAWGMLRVTVENAGDPFAATIRVRETRGGEATHFVGAARAELRRGTNSFDVLFAPGDPSAGTALEIVRAGDGPENGEEVVFRSGLSRLLAPLARDERLVLSVGAASLPLQSVESVRVWALDPRELPREPRAYGSVDALVLGHAGRSEVSRAQARAAGAYVLGGGRMVFASFRSVEAFESVIFGEGARPPRGLAELRSALPGSRVRSGTDARPRVVEFPFGLGRGAIFALEPGDAPGWCEAEAARLLAREGEGGGGFLARRASGAFVDAGAFVALASSSNKERPFAAAAARGRLVAIVGALLATVGAVLLARARRAVAAAAVGGGAVAWAVVAMLVWREPAAAARVVRVRAFSADARAEVVTDTAALLAFDEDATVAFETQTGPALPVARRPGEAFAEPFALERRESGWRTSRLLAWRGAPLIVRATSARATSDESLALRTRVLARGARVRSTALPGGGRRLSPVGAELPRDVRYFLERFALPCDELAWAWVEGAPEGAAAPGCDESPGSGTLVIAGVPPAAPSAGARD